MRSTSTSGSCSKACANAPASSASDEAFEMPTDEPSRAGFTNTGGASPSRPSHWPWRAYRVVDLGYRVRGEEVLEQGLSIATADAATPAPT